MFGIRLSLLFFLIFSLAELALLLISAESSFCSDSGVYPPISGFPIVLLVNVYKYYFELFRPRHKINHQNYYSIHNRLLLWRTTFYYPNKTIKIYLNLHIIQTFFNIIAHHQLKIFYHTYYATARTFRGNNKISEISRVLFDFFG